MVSFQKTLPKERNHLEKDIKYSLIVKKSPKSNSLSKVIVQKCSKIAAKLYIQVNSDLLKKIRGHQPIASVLCASASVLHLFKPLRSCCAGFG